MSNGGKGDKQRPVDRKKFNENWDRIFGKKVVKKTTPEQEISCKMQ